MTLCEADGGVRRLVLETLGSVPKDRKCFRLINGILVERTVEEVVPVLQTNANGLNSVLEGLVKEYKEKQEMDTWKVYRSYCPSLGMFFYAAAECRREKTRGGERIL